MVFPVFRFFTMVLCGKQWKILVYIILNFWLQRKTGKIFTEMDIFPRCLIVKTRQPWYSIFMRKRKESQKARRRQGRRSLVLEELWTKR